jgi:hypothetical protein
MRIIGVSMVRNEADVIECFVRHHCRLLDHLVVVDHDSSDRTREILAALHAEGLPLQLAQTHALANRQAQVLTTALRAAVREHGADYAFALDADEFLRTDRTGLETALRALPPDGVGSLRWLTYLPGDDDEPHPLVRLRWRVPDEADHYVKVALGAALAARDGWVLAPGNHDVFVGAAGQLTRVNARPLPDLRLAHLPFRTVEQLIVKVVQGWLGTRLQEGQRAATGAINAHWRRLFEHYLAGGRFAQDDLRRMALTTYIGPAGEHDLLQRLLEDPLPAPALRYTTGEPPDAARTLAHWANRLVDQLASARTARNQDQMRANA